MRSFVRSFVRSFFAAFVRDEKRGVTLTLTMTMMDFLIVRQLFAHTNINERYLRFSHSAEKINPMNTRNTTSWHDVTNSRNDMSFLLRTCIVCHVSGLLAQLEEYVLVHDRS